MAEKRCFYEILGVARDSSPDDLRRAYKKEALKHHPDRNGGDPKAEAAFKEVNEAYQVLSDEQKRQVYDRFGHAGLEGGAGFGGAGGGIGDVFAHMQDLFSEMFTGGFSGGRAQRGGDLRVQQRLTFQEAAFGCKREVVVHAPTRCSECSGTGAKPGTKPESCGQCRGSGQVSTSRGFVMFTQTCPRCRGQGAVIKHACKTCEGRGAVEKRLAAPGRGLASFGTWVAGERPASVFTRATWNGGAEGAIDPQDPRARVARGAAVGMGASHGAGASPMGSSEGPYAPLGSSDLVAG
jgi:molecular chaperone DnaJ